MKQKIKSISVLLSFFVLFLAPQALRAQEVSECLKLIENNWKTEDGRVLIGSTRHQTDCRFEMTIQSDKFEIAAEGEPLEVNFRLGDTNSWSQKLHSCRVDKEKLHLAFEQKSLDSFERKEKIQMTLLRRKDNKGLSLILSQKQLKVFLPTNQSNLICHLQLSGPQPEAR